MRTTKSKKYLIVDLGASNGRIIIGHFLANKFDLEIIHRFDNKPMLVSGIYYWDIAKLFSEIKTGITLSNSKYEKIISMSIDTWGLDFGIISTDGKLISNPVAYRDKSKNERSPYKLLKTINAEEFFNLTGSFINPAAPAFFLEKMVSENSYEFQHAKKILMMPDLFNYLLCGNFTSEYTIASNTLMVNCKTKKYEKKIIENVGISKNLLPEIVNSGTKVGLLSSKICEELDLNPLPVIAAIEHDTASAIAGIPVVSQNRKWAFLSTGTWLILGVETVRPILDFNILNYKFVNEGGVSGKTFFARDITGFWIAQKCLEKWEKDYGTKFTWKDIDKIYPKAKPFKTFIDVDDPIFSQSHNNMPEVMQNYCKKMDLAIPENVSEICRCIYESLVMKVKSLFDVMRKFIKKDIDFLYIFGGGVNNKLFCQWISNLLQIKVITGPVEATSTGNLIMQLKVDNEIKNIKEGRELSFNSNNPSYFEPQDVNIWKEKYSVYLNIFYK